MTTFAGRSILVTGGTGSFGRAFARAALVGDARRLVIFSRDEAKQAAMRAAMPDTRLRFFVGDVRDASRVMDAVRGCDTVVHAAAMKRVETCEADPTEAVATNVIGTGNVARACVERGIRRAILLSTDKAAEPNTLYGFTKATAERLWTQYNVHAAGLPTRFAATRYGNVLGSTGSVLEIWRAQKAQGAVSVTDPRMTRFWMSMGEAVDLVTLALRELRGGEIYVPKIGALAVVELARLMCGPAEVRYTGIRPGEKLHETLVTEHEARRTHDAGEYYVIEPEARTWEALPPLGHPLVPEGFRYRSDTTARPDSLFLPTMEAA